MRDILRRLEAARFIKLPPPLKTMQNPKIDFANDFSSRVDTTQVTQIDWNEVTVVEASEREQIQLWDYLVDSHHYLGKKTIVGRNLRQLICVANQPIGCVGWCDPSLKLAPRDDYLAKTFANGLASVNHGVNNTRFLILPWVTIPNLASKALALAKRHMRLYWLEYYNIELAWAETFVDPTRFAGTCYLAANWKKVGQTTGTSRSGANARRKQHGVAKDILLYIFPNSVREARLG